MNQNQQDKQSDKLKLSPLMQYILLFVFILVIVGVLYLTFVRYTYAGKAIQKGNILGTLAMLSPELTGTIGAIINR